MTNPMREKSIDDVVQYLHNGGILADREWFLFARDTDAFKYIGYFNGDHRYLVGFKDEENDDNYYASVVYVNLGCNGLICADFGGCPEFESNDPEKVLEYIEKRCN